ncbi:uncharacterized protein [Centroberyx affinis]|uniref:uncharacterized protein isoform X2 n=1 Tax=Centroberyx affinis TaxID=166261 RepID=UPI003A5C3AF8
MRFVAPVFLFLAVAGFHTGLTASLESAEKNETVVQEGAELSELQKRDQIEFEATQKNEEQTEDTRYLEAVQDETEEQIGTEDDNIEGDGISAVTAHDESESESASTEDTDGVRHKREQHEAVTENVSIFEEVSVDATKQQDVVV